MPGAGRCSLRSSRVCRSYVGDDEDGHRALVHEAVGRGTEDDAEQRSIAVAAHHHHLTAQPRDRIDQDVLRVAVLDEGRDRGATAQSSSLTLAVHRTLGKHSPPLGPPRGQEPGGLVAPAVVDDLTGHDRRDKVQVVGKQRQVGAGSERERAAAGVTEDPGRRR